MLHRQADATLHRAKGSPNDLGDLGLRQTAEVGQFDHCALIGIEIVERTPDVAFELMLHDNLSGSAAISCTLAGCTEFDRRAGPTQTIDRRIAQYRQKPRSNPAADDAASARPEGKKGLLRQIVRARTICTHARCERGNSRAMTAVEFLECIGATRDDEAQKRPIIECVYLLERSPHAT